MTLSAGMNRVFCALVSLISYGCAAAAAPAPPIDPYIETAIDSRDTCSGDFKTSALQSKVGNRQFTDTLAKTITTPILWNQFRGERDLFGYAPAFTPNRISLAANGRPLVRDRQLNLQVLKDDGRWMKVPLLDAFRQSIERQGLISQANPWVPRYGPTLFDSGPQTEERVVFDSACNAYTVINANYSSLGQAFLMYSHDGGHSWAAFSIPGTKDTLYTVSLEAPVNGLALRSPPALILAEKYDPTAANGSNPSNAHKAWLLIPVASANNALKFSGPFLISDHTLCCGGHSGFEAQAVSYGDDIYVAYPGDRAVSDPITNRPGTPQYIQTFSRTSGSFLGGPEFVGVGLVGPQNQPETPAYNQADSHNQTALAIDRAGYIHIVIGGHGSRMIYRRSMQPDDGSHWTEPEIFSLQPRDKNDVVDEYSYPSLVLDSSGEPQVLARWSGKGYTFRLVYTYRSNKTGTWSPQQVLLDPGRAYYGVWYHKLTIDPWDRLFIDYSYYPDNLFADEAAQFAKQYGFALRVQPSTPACIPTNLSAAKPNYCHFLGYQDVGGAILARRAPEAAFELATTANFFEF
jgi:hypothetical protein